jgi:hypothetical protein
MNEEGRPPGGQPQRNNNDASKYRGGGGGRIPLLPLGERGWYPYRACAHCGARKNLRPAILVTYAEALVCEDNSVCLRRCYSRRENTFERVDQGRAA